MILGALALSLVFTAVFCLPRLPATLDGLLPRRAGFALLARAVTLGERSGGRLAVRALLYLLLAAAAWTLGRRALAAWRRLGPRLAAASPGARAGRVLCAAAGAVLLLQAARFAAAAALDLLQNVFYAPESLSLAEPAWTWLAFFWCALALLNAAAALAEWALSGDRLSSPAARRGLAWCCALLVPGIVLYGWAAASFDARRPSLAAAAALPPEESGFRRLLILTEAEGKPSQEPFTLPLGEPGQSDYTPARLDAAEKYAERGPSVYRRTALRFLYSGRTFLMDAEGLRRALLLGTRLDDPLARALLLENAGCAPDGAQAREALAALSDEGRWRAGAWAAARLSEAYARLGDAAAARAWSEKLRGSAGSPAPGLLPEAGPPAGPARGVVEGELAGGAGLRVALYCRPTEFSPYTLGAGQLAAAASADARGRFRFESLPEGSYFLAVAEDGPRRPERDLSLLGHRGDLVLTRRRPEARVRLAVRR